MKKITMIRRLKLNDESFETIKNAVKKAESTTSGEIALAVIPESAQYSIYELLFALVFGVILFACLIPFSNNIFAYLDRSLWGASLWHLTTFFGIFSFGCIGILFFIGNIPFIDRIIIPPAVRTKTVYNRALRHFVESGVYATANRTGILLFVSYMEREVRILADTGISSKIAPELWNLIATDLAEGLGTDDATGAFIRAIERCGELLTEYFPAPNNPELNPDELPDGLVVLGDDECL